ARGADGAIWFTENTANKIGRVTTNGVFTEFPISPGSHPEGIAAGPDGNVWFAATGISAIGRVTAGGVVTNFPTPTADSSPTGITSGPGFQSLRLWFTENGANHIARRTTAGVITEFAVPTTAAGLEGIATGRYSDIWFTEQTAGKIGVKPNL